MRLTMQRRDYLHHRYMTSMDWVVVLEEQIRDSYMNGDEVEAMRLTNLLKRETELCEALKRALDADTDTFAVL